MNLTIPASGPYPFMKHLLNDATATRAWLADKLYARARLASSRMHLESRELTDAP